MDSAMAAVVVAVITTIGAIIVGLMQAFKNEAREAVKSNNEDHAIVQQQLGMIFKSVSRVDDKLEKHITQHDEGDNGQTFRRDREPKT